MSVDTAELQQLVRRPFFLITVGVVIVALLLWWLVWWSPEGSKLATLKAQETSLQASVSGLQARLASLEHSKAGLPKSCGTLVKISKLIPSSEDEPTLLSQLSLVGLGSGVSIGSVSPAAPTTTPTTTATPGVPAGITPLAISISASGSFKQDVAFVNDLVTMPRLIVINSISVSGQLEPVQATKYSVTISGTFYMGSSTALKPLVAKACGLPVPASATSTSGATATASHT